MAKIESLGARKGSILKICDLVLLVHLVDGRLDVGGARFGSGETTK